MSATRHTAVLCCDNDHEVTVTIDITRDHGHNRTELLGIVQEECDEGCTALSGTVWEDRAFNDFINTVQDRGE